jgi:hypothetical protein
MEDRADWEAQAISNAVGSTLVIRSLAALLWDRPTRFFGCWTPTSTQAADRWFHRFHGSDSNAYTGSLDECLFIDARPGGT